MAKPWPERSVSAANKSGKQLAMRRESSPARALLGASARRFMTPIDVGAGRLRWVGEAELYSVRPSARPHFPDARTHP